MDTYRSEYVTKQSVTISFKIINIVDPPMLKARLRICGMNYKRFLNPKKTIILLAKLKEFYHDSRDE